MRRILTTACAGVAVVAVVLAGGLAAEGNNPESVVYLVRHAEKASAATDPLDPPLSAIGTARAQALAELLADIDLVSIHSTGSRRTRLTAQPVADAQDLEVQTYDPFDRAMIANLVGMLQTTPGSHLVVGHSNTTPEMVAELGGDPGSAIAEDEYDRLYVVTLGEDGAVETQLSRYGETTP